MKNSPKFLSTAQLPEPLRTAVEDFIPVARVEGYHVDEDGMCFTATEHFVSTLEGYGFGKYDGVDYFDRFAFQFKLASNFRHRALLPYRDNGAIFHWVARVMGYVIDWTAYQFDRSLPFPVIWEEADWPLEMEKEMTG